MTMEAHEIRHEERVTARDEAEKKDEKKKEREAEEWEKQARKEVVVKSLEKIMAMEEREVTFQCKWDALKDFDYDSFTAKSHPVIKRAKERLVALNELYISEKGEYSKMSNEDKLEQHDDAVGGFMKQTQTMDGPHTVERGPGDRPSRWKTEYVS